MKIDVKGERTNAGKINELVDYLEDRNTIEIYNYCGMKVEIDPTVDYKDQNLLVRWTDIEEGFNDKIILNSLEEFTSLFS